MRYYAEFWSHPKIIGVSVIIILNALVVWFTPGHAVTWWVIVVGMLLFSINEYLVHRFLLHEFPRLLPKAYEGHVAHHEHPNDIHHIFGPIYYDLLIFGIIYVGMYLITHSLHIAAALALGFSIFQLYYQWIHFISHRPIIPLFPWARWLKRMHLLHHFKDEHLWYGVTHPYLDIMTGTYEKVKRKNSKYFRKELKRWYTSKFHR